MSVKNLCAIVVFVFALSGCGQPRTEDAAALKKVFEKPAPGQQSTEFSEVKGVVDQAINAVSEGDLPRAIETLTVARLQQNLSDDQREAIQNVMGSVQTQLANRAEAGDVAAKEALERYRAMKRR